MVVRQASTHANEDDVHFMAINGVTVPHMAVGTWSWGDKGRWNHKEDDLPAIRSAWHACNAVGLTFYDTAEVYGDGASETIIGNLLKETEPEIRKKIYIATKFLSVPRPTNFFIFKPAVVTACRKSLARLGVDQIDLYQHHSNIGIHSLESTAHGLAECVKLGMCKAIGVSNYSKEELLKIIKVLDGYGIALASNQVEFSLLRKLPQTSGLLDLMKEHNVALLAYSPLGMGRLTGKYSAENPIPNNRHFGAGQTWEQLKPLLDAIKEIAEQRNVTMSAVSLNWVICKGGIPLGGARNEKQAKENARAMTFRLTDEEVGRLEALGFEGKTGWWQHG